MILNGHHRAEIKIEWINNFLRCIFFKHYNKVIQSYFSNITFNQTIGSLSENTLREDLRATLKMMRLY